MRVEVRLRRDLADRTLQVRDRSEVHVGQLGVEGERRQIAEVGVFLAHAHVIEVAVNQLQQHRR